MNRPRATVLGVALALVVAACGGGGTTSHEPVATSTVNLPRSYQFDPPAITVPAGTTVTWTNNDQFTHTVTFDGQAEQRIGPGESTTHDFPTAGSYHYVCSLHPQNMQGTVVVTAP
jgi:plastocyanin